MFDIAQVVTDKIIKAIEAGTDKWQMPWHAVNGMAVAPASIDGRAYRGMNVWLLMIAAEEAGYDSNVWGTYKAWLKKGCPVQKGAKGTLVVFWKRTDYKTKNDSGEDVAKKGMLLRYYTVFNSEQVEGYEPTRVEPLPIEERIANAETFFNNCEAVVHHGGNRAFYAPSQDSIQLPLFEQFKSAEGYYATRGHETVHWTGHESRCAREFGRRFGDHAYAFEELVAELGAAFLCTHLGLSNEPRPDHAQYIKNWLDVLKSDKKAVFTAASKAQAALDFLTKSEEDEEEVAEAA
jgi:antirestriction protein ArdC